MPTTFSMSVDCDNNTGDILAVYFFIRRGKSAQTVEHCNGAAMVDYNKAGELLGIELLAPCRLTVLNRIKGVEAAVRKFVQKAAPRAMVLA